MSELSLVAVTRLARIAFLVGAVTDGLAVLPMLSRRVGVKLFGGDASNRSSRVSLRYAPRRVPHGRLDCPSSLGRYPAYRETRLLLLTVVPVVAGILAATGIAARRGVLRTARVLPLWFTWQRSASSTLWSMHSRAGSRTSLSEHECCLTPGSTGLAALAG